MSLSLSKDVSVPLRVVRLMQSLSRNSISHAQYQSTFIFTPRGLDGKLGGQIRENRSGVDRKLTLNVSSLNGLGDGLGALSINLATNAKGRAQNLLHGTLKTLGERLVPHRASNLDDLIECNRLVVLNVLLLLPVARGFLQGSDNEGGCGRNDRNSGLAVLDSELHRNTKSLL